MKLLVKKILNKNIIINLRNLLNIYPVHMSINNISCATVSDAFLWRTDDNFKTIFKFSDILNTFYNIKSSWVELEFYSKKNEFIKKEKILSLNYSNEIKIDKYFMNNIEDYGTFYIHHYTKEKIPKENIISNRCYVGYSQRNNLYSFVHGNTLAKVKNINNEDISLTEIVKLSPIKNQSYKIQKFFDKFDKNELFISNPTSQTINFSIDEKNYILNNGCSVIVEFRDKEIIQINSNCLFLRPVVFSYKGSYFDVHHG